MIMIKKLQGIYNHMPGIWQILCAGIIIMLGLSMLGSATTLTSSNSTPTKIFKCQASTITANLSGYVGDVYVNLTSGHSFESYLMVNLGAGNYIYTYGNDPNLIWGNKSLSFYAAPDLLLSPSYIFVYSDPCSGSNIQGYRNVSYRATGFGNYTRALFSGDRNLIEFAQQPYLDYFGYSIYLLMLFTFCGILYLKNQSIMQPLMLGFLALSSLVLSSLVPPAFKTYILLIMAVALAAIFYRLFKSA
jgi:hypothetical protein